MFFDLIPVDDRLAVRDISLGSGFLKRGDEFLD